MGKATKPKEMEDMGDEEFQTMVLRRQYFGPFLKKMRNTYEVHQIYQILFEELALIGAKLPSDKMNYAINEAQRAVGLEVAALRKKLQST